MLKRWLPILLVLCATALTFAHVVRHDFVMWDDGTNVYENPYFRVFSWSNIGQFWREPYEGLYVPLTYTVWSIVGAVARGGGSAQPGATLNPHVYHAANLAVHLGCVLAVYSILRLLVRSAWPAAAGAALFALHPVQVEAVAWVTGMKDLLCGLFCLLAIYQYLLLTRVRAGEQPPSRRTPLHVVFGSLWFVCALCAKPAAVVTPLLAVLLAWLQSGTPRPDRRLLRTHLPGFVWLVLAVGWVLLTRRVQTTRGLTVFAPGWARPLIAGDAMSFYVWKLLVPLRYAIDYGRVPTLLMQKRWLWVTGLLPYAAAIALFRWRRRLPWCRVAALVFAVGVLPVLGLVPFAHQRISTVADRYLYVAMLGAALAFGHAAARAGAWRRNVALAGCVAILAGLGVRSRGQAGTWRDDETLFAHTIRVNPKSSISYNNLGMRRWREGRKPEAIDFYRRALAAKPDNVKALNNLGVALLKEGNVAEAAALHERALAHKPRDIPTHLHLATALERQGRLAEAEACCRRALGVAPDFALTHFRLGSVLVRQGRVEEGLRHLRTAGGARHDFSPELVALAGLLARDRRWEAAVAVGTLILAKHPDYEDMHLNVGNFLKELGRKQAAARHYREAIRLDPGYARAHYCLANVLAGDDKMADAVAHYSRALEADPKFSAAYNNLANALAALGRIDEAIAHYEHLLRIEPDNGDARRNLAAIRALKK